LHWQCRLVSDTEKKTPMTMNIFTDKVFDLLADEVLTNAFLRRRDSSRLTGAQ
jgi:hypothetical protein